MNVLGGRKCWILATTITTTAQKGDLLEHYTEQKADHLERTIRLSRRQDGSYGRTVQDVQAVRKPPRRRNTFPNRPLGACRKRSCFFPVVLQRAPVHVNAGRAWRARKFMSHGYFVAHEAGRVIPSVQRKVRRKDGDISSVEPLDNPKSRVMSVYDADGILQISRVGSIEMRRRIPPRPARAWGGASIPALTPSFRVANRKSAPTDKLELQLEGPFAAPEFMNTQRYRWKAFEGGKKKLILTRDTLDAWEMPKPDITAADVKKYLMAEPNIESDDPEIVALAKKPPAASKGVTAVDVVRAVVDFVAITCRTLCVRTSTARAWWRSCKRATAPNTASWLRRFCGLWDLRRARWAAWAS
jgi:hypothetical protein